MTVHLFDNGRVRGRPCGYVPVRTYGVPHRDAFSLSDGVKEGAADGKMRKNGYRQLELRAGPKKKP